MDGRDTDICVIGAGMAGLACATSLVAAGRKVRVFDKGRGPGGRMAARRAEIVGETVSFDHGAQYFTARDAGFCKAVSGWTDKGVAARWPAAGDDAFVGVPGMNGPIRAMAQDCKVTWGTRVEAIRRVTGGWTIGTGAGAITATTVLVAIPAEQASELLGTAAPDLAAVAAGVVSEPCWAVMASFADRLDLPDSVRAATDTERVAWGARNSSKPQRTGNECWVIHASAKRSRELIDRPREEVAAIVLDDFFAQTGISPASPMHLAAHRWLYSKPDAIDGGDSARYDAQAQIGIAGDYLHSPRVEGAWISGTKLAENVLANT